MQRRISVDARSSRGSVTAASVARYCAKTGRRPRLLAMVRGSPRSSFGNFVAFVALSPGARSVGMGEEARLGARIFLRARRAMMLFAIP